MKTFQTSKGFWELIAIECNPSPNDRFSLSTQKSEMFITAMKNICRGKANRSWFPYEDVAGATGNSFTSFDPNVCDKFWKDWDALVQERTTLLKQSPVPWDDVMRTLEASNKLLLESASQNLNQGFP